MIKKTLLGLFILAIMAACNTTVKTDAEEARDQIPEVTVMELMENSDMYVNKPIMISGTIDHVCREGGKKMFLLDKENEKRIKITVGKDIPSFDVELEGSELLVTGVFQELVIDEDYLAKWEEELKSKHDALEEDHAQTEHGEMADQGTHVGDMQQIDSYREQLEESGEDHISFYSIECKKFSKKEGTE